MLNNRFQTNNLSLPDLWHKTFFRLRHNEQPSQVSFNFLTVDLTFLPMIFIECENFVASIDVGPKTSTPTISPFLFKSRMRLSEIGSLSAAFPLFSWM